MLILSLDELRPNMKLAAPVLNPESPDKILLKSGYELQLPVIARLRDLAIDSVYVDYPGLDDLDKHLAANLSPARQEMYNQVKRAVQVNQQNTRAAVNYKDYYACTRDLITTLLTQGQHPIYLDQMNRMGSDAVAHATAVAHLSLVLGMKLDHYLIDQRKRLTPHRAKEVVNLGVAGMLHDIGKTKLPEHLQRCTGIDTPEDAGDRHEWEKHARIGYEMVHASLEPTAAAAVLHHHQHYDGSGFPHKVENDGTKTHYQGDRIHVFSRILMVADLYDRLSTLDGGKRRPNIETLHLMRTRYAHWADPVVFRTLSDVAPPFPPGSRLTLSDGSLGVVTSIPIGDPFLPTIRLLQEDQWTLSDEYIDLRIPGAPKVTMVGRTSVASVLNDSVAGMALATS